VILNERDNEKAKKIASSIMVYTSAGSSCWYLDRASKEGKPGTDRKICVYTCVQAGALNLGI
jgi:hypothetical protein